VGFPLLHSRAAAPPALDGPGGLLLGREPDAGPIRPGTLAQPRPMLFRQEAIADPDPMAALRSLKRRAALSPGPSLGPLPADAAQYRRLMDQWAGVAPAGLPRGAPAGSAPALPPRGFRITSSVSGQWADRLASPVAWGKLPLAAGKTITLEARNTVGGKPLLYLVREGHQVAFGAATETAADAPVSLTYTPDTDGDFQFLVRGGGDGSVGSCDLFLDGQPLFPGVRFGGTALPAAWASGDQFQTAHLPAPENRVVDTVLYAFDGRDRFVGRNDDGGVNGCSRLVMASASTRPDAHVLVACAYQDPRDSGLVRLYVNRLSQGDPDGDGLATPLEEELGTDSQVADTDGDGLRDDWELFGLHTPAGDEDLPAYSDPWTPGRAANPTRLDLFVEMDWMAGPNGNSAYYRLTDAGMERAVRALREHGGVWLHLDVGQMGARASRGGQSFDYQSRFHFTTTSPLDMQDLWSSPDQFAASRRHLFAYGLAIDRFAPGLNTSGEMRRIYENGQVISTSEVWNPRYNPGFLICNGTGLYNQPTKQAGVLMHELGHCLHLHHGGNVDTNNKPNYLSVMNYLFTLGGLSADGDIDYSRGALPSLDESALNETAGLGFAPPDFLYGVIRGPRRRDIRSSANPGAIDWNSNGLLDSSPVVTDVNSDGVQEVLSDFNDWREATRPTRGFGWVGVNVGIEDWTSFNDAP
jgi:hypothetical protein